MALWPYSHVLMCHVHVHVHVRLQVPTFIAQRSLPDQPPQSKAALPSPSYARVWNSYIYIYIVFYLEHPTFTRTHTCTRTRLYSPAPPGRPPHKHVCVWLSVCTYVYICICTYILIRGAEWLYRHMALWQYSHVPMRHVRVHVHIHVHVFMAQPPLPVGIILWILS